MSGPVWRAPRVTYTCVAKVWISREAFECRTVNLSQSGLLGVFPVPCEAGTILRLDLPLPGFERPMPISGVVVRSTELQGDYACGVQFEPLSPGASEVLENFLRGQIAAENPRPSLPADAVDGVDHDRLERHGPGPGVAGPGQQAPLQLPVGPPVQHSGGHHGLAEVPTPAHQPTSDPQPGEDTPGDPPGRVDAPDPKDAADVVLWSADQKQPVQPRPTQPTTAPASLPDTSVELLGPAPDELAPVALAPRPTDQTVQEVETAVERITPRLRDELTAPGPATADRTSRPPEEATSRPVPLYEPLRPESSVSPPPPRPRRPPRPTAPFEPVDSSLEREPGHRSRGPRPRPAALAPIHLDEEDRPDGLRDVPEWRETREVELEEKDLYQDVEKAERDLKRVYRAAVADLERSEKKTKKKGWF